MKPKRSWRTYLRRSRQLPNHRCFFNINILSVFFFFSLQLLFIHYDSVKTCDYFMVFNLNGDLFLLCSEINHSSAVIEEEIEKCKGSALERKRALNEDRDNFQKAAYAVLDMLNRE